MRPPSGAAAAPWFTSIPSMMPTTLLVAGSIRWTLSPAELVWMIRTFCCAPSETAQSVVAAISVNPERMTRVFVILRTSLLRRLSHDPRLENLPLRVVLRREVLAAIVVEVAAGLLFERVNEQSALQAAGNYHAPNGSEVLLR